MSNIRKRPENINFEESQQASLEIDGSNEDDLKDDERTLTKQITDFLYSLVVFCCTSYFFIVELKLFDILLHSRKIDRIALNIGMIFYSFCAVIKVYMEEYKGKVLKEKVVYDNFKTLTHTVIVCGLLGYICLCKAFWPLWGSQSIFLLIIFAYAIFLQLCNMTPGYINNVIFAGMYGAYFYYCLY